MQFINTWMVGSGEPLKNFNPATGVLSWSGFSASEEEVQQAVTVAHQATQKWQMTTFEERVAILQSYAKLLDKKLILLAECIAEETGKPLWESKTEVAAMISKIELSIAAYHERTGLIEKPLTGGVSITRHKPLGVMAVLGPYNFPGHLPNGQIVPALLAGNTIVFKPSEFTPQTAILIVKIWQEAGLPPDVLSLILGGAKTGQILASHPKVNGVLFTGSYTSGKKLHEQCAGQPEKLLALEMGGNNPLIVWQPHDLEAAAYHIVQSAFLSAGQRCTCARRLIISDDKMGEQLLATLVRWIKRIKIGYWREHPEPFMGPLIHKTAAKNILSIQQQLLLQGGESLISMQPLLDNTAFVSPGLIDVTPILIPEDREIFGPLLQVIRAKDFSTALQMANQTQYGLVAGLYSDDINLYQEFYSIVRAGVLSWNRALTGASSAAPFGGIGHSGNYRPGAFYTADACAYPVVSSESKQLTLPEKLTPGLMNETS